MENKQEMLSMVHHSANQIALEAVRREGTENPAKTYKEVYGEVYDFLISKHEDRR